MGSVSTFHTTNIIKLAAIRAANERGIPVAELCEHLLVQHLVSRGYIDEGAAVADEKPDMVRLSGLGGIK